MSYTDRRVEKHDYENLRVVNSFKFMASSLDKLVSYLPAENISLLDNHFPQHYSEDLQLLHQKRFHPYSYFDSQEKIQEKPLPSVGKWTSSLQDGQVSITPAKFQHALKVSQKFGCENR